MAFSKARRLGDLITANAEQFITSAHITDTAITGTDIHSTFDLTGKTVTVATASSGDNDTSVASTAFVQQEIASLVDSAPGTLNTLNELAAALGDDANFSTTVTNSIATKLPLAGGTLTGDVTFTGTSANIVFDQSDNALEFATNAKAVFGGSLSISRIGNSSYIHETGSGDLYIKGSDIYITDQDNNQFIHLDDDGTGGTVRLKHEGSTKLSTTSTGATLTGTLNIDSNGGTDNYYLKFLESGADRFTMYENSNNVYLNGGPGNTHFRPRQNGGTGNFVISGSNVGIGTTSPENNLHIFTDSGDEGLTIKATGNTSNAIISDANRSGSGSAINQLLGRWNGTNVCDVRFITGGDTTNKDDGEITFHTSSANNLAERMRIDSSGNVGISNTSPSALLHVGADGVSVNTTTDVSRTAIFRTTGTGNYSSSGNNSASHAATFMRGNAVNTGDQVGHSYVFNNGGWSATAEIMAEVEDNSTAYSRLNFKTWRGGMATRQVITSEGYVVKAYQPYIRCAGNTASMAANQGTTADYSNWADQAQRGITRSGATFTVPIAGEYMITYSFYNWINNSGPNVTHAAYLQKNGSTIQETVAEYDFENDAFSYMDNQLQNSLILNMAAGDTFKFVTYADIYGGSTHTNMSAYLLG